MRSWEPEQRFVQTRSRLAPDPSGRARLNRAHDEVTASLFCLTVRVRSAFPGKLKVELHGLAVYDPTTGEIRSSSTDSNSTLAPATLQDNTNGTLWHYAWCSRMLPNT